MAIGLYDIDLWHGRKSFPNLELMQIYDILYKEDYIVKMLKKGEDLTPYSKIIYFKDNLATEIPKTLNVMEDRAKRIGYGFSGQEPKLEEKYLLTSPSYLPYDAWTEKLSVKKTYDKIKNSSLIKVSTNNFGDFKKDKKNLFITDHEFLQSSAAESFMSDYKKYNYIFLNHLRIDNEKELKTYIRFNNLITSYTEINFRFKEDLFYENFREKIVFTDFRMPFEKDINRLCRITKIFLWYKSKGICAPYSICKSKDRLEKEIYKWGTKKTFESFSSFNKDNKTIQNLILHADTDLRLLLKQNPKYVTKDNLNLKVNL